MGPPTDPGPSGLNEILVTRATLGTMVSLRGGLTTHGAPQAIGDHGATVSLPKLKKAYEKGTRGISWGPLLTPGPQARVSKWSVRPWCHSSCTVFVRMTTFT
ncbi:unnamed protein product, partial [Staurois parvus]